MHPPPQLCVSHFTRVAASVVTAVALFAGAAGSTTALAKALYVKADKPIIDEQGRTRVIVDFQIDAHPVSYTHLDVYKRQLVLLLMAGSWWCVQGSMTPGQLMEFLLLVGFLYAVSYTHLDVYKRQL